MLLSGRGIPFISFIHAKSVIHTSLSSMFPEAWIKRTVLCSIERDLPPHETPPTFSRICGDRNLIDYPNLLIYFKAILSI
jgi:hypothetical protein